MTEPTKAAIRRVQDRFCEAPDVGGDFDVAMHAFALEIDRVDRIAREAVERSIKRGDPPNERTGLVSLMLPGEPDPLEELLSEWGLTNALRGECADKFRQAADRLGLVIDVRRKGEEG